MLIASSVMAAPPAIRRAVWLQWRRTGIGASDVAGILGISPYTSAMRVWAEKVHGVSDRSENDKQTYGRYAEPMLSAWFNDHRAPLVCRNPQLLVHHSRERMHHLASLDALAFENDDTTDTEHEIGGIMYRDPTDAVAVIEMKSEGIGSPWIDDEPPDHYKAQAQWHMHVTGLSSVIFVVVHGWRFETYELPRNDRDIEMIVREVDRFWYEHVQTQTPPDRIDGSDATMRTIADLFPTDDSITGEPTETEISRSDLVDMIEARRNAAFWTERANAARAEIEMQMGTATFGTVRGKRVVSWRTTRPQDPDPRTMGAERVRNYARIPERARPVEPVRTFRILDNNTEEQ